MRLIKARKEPDGNAEALLKQALLPSVLSIFLCTVLLCGTTFAWMTDSVYTDGSVLTAGHFAIDVTVQNGNGETVPVYDNRVRLAGAEEAVQYTAYVDTHEGSVGQGYALLTVGMQTYRIDTFAASLQIQFEAGQTAEITFGFLPYWGSKPTSVPALPSNARICVTSAGIVMATDQEKSR